MSEVGTVGSENVSKGSVLHIHQPSNEPPQLVLFNTAIANYYDYDKVIVVLLN